MKDLTAGAHSFQDSLDHDYQSETPFKTLFDLYRRDLNKIWLSMFLYVIKHSSEWIQPLVAANIVDIISSPAKHPLWELGLNGVVLVASIGQNISTHYLHIRFMSIATRKMEANLRDSCNICQSASTNNAVQGCCKPSCFKM